MLINGDEEKNMDEENGKKLHDNSVWHNECHFIYIYKGIRSRLIATKLFATYEFYWNLMMI